MDWFRDKNKRHLFVLLSESLPDKSKRLSLINVDTNRIHHLIFESTFELINAFLDESPQRLLLHFRLNGEADKMQFI